MTRRTSRKRTSLRRNSYTGDRVDPAGKKVVMAFLDKRSADSAKLRTDGKRLDGLWMGGRGIAEWVGDKIVLHDLGSRSAQTIQNIIRREAPANWLKANVGRRTSRHDRGRRSSRATRRTSLRRNSDLGPKVEDMTEGEQRTMLSAPGRFRTTHKVGGLKTGQVVSWRGKKWTIWDFQAEGRTVLLVLFSRTRRQIARYVPIPMLDGR